MRNNNESQAWANLPIHLNRHEMLNPFQFIKEFYTIEIDLIDCRKCLKIWFRSAINNKCLLSKDQIVSLIWFKDYMIKLIEAGYVICNDYPDELPDVIINSDDDQALTDPAVYCDPKLNITPGGIACPGTSRGKNLKTLIKY